MAVTIRDVAEKAGVTKAVVSAILNGRQSSIRVAEETRQRVRQAAQDLHYRPNALARGLASKRTDTIGVVPQWAGYLSVWSGFTSEMMQGISAAAIREGYGVLLDFRAAGGLEHETAGVMDGRIDGALLWRARTDPMPERLQAQNFPAVMMFGVHDNPEIWYADCDNVLGGRRATEYLLSLGHTRILHLSAESTERYVHDRRAGYEQALRDAGIAVRSEWIVNVRWDGADEPVYEQIRSLLTAPGAPTAVFAWYDGIAIDLLQKARE